MGEWRTYDPAWLVDWLRASGAGEPWLADALARCTRAMDGGRAYLHFVDPADAGHPGAAWRWERNLTLEHPTEGTLVVDVLAGDRVGGIEFLRRL